MYFLNKISFPTLCILLSLLTGNNLFSSQMPEKVTLGAQRARLIQTARTSHTEYEDQEAMLENLIAGSKVRAQQNHARYAQAELAKATQEKRRKSFARAQTVSWLSAVTTSAIAWMSPEHRTTAGYVAGVGAIAGITSWIATNKARKNIESSTSFMKQRDYNNIEWAETSTKEEEAMLQVLKYPKIQDACVGADLKCLIDTASRISAIHEKATNRKKTDDYTYIAEAVSMHPLHETIQRDDKTLQAFKRYGYISCSAPLPKSEQTELLTLAAKHPKK